MKAGKEEITCLLDVGGKGSVQTSVQVPVIGIKFATPAHELVIKNAKAERSCLLDGKTAVFMLKQELIPGQLKIQREISITRYHPDPVENTMEEKQKIPGEWICQREVDNTQCHFGCVESTIKERVIIPGGWNSKKNMKH